MEMKVSLMALLCSLFFMPVWAGQVSVMGPSAAPADFVFETIQEGTAYYIYNLGTGSFLNDENGLDEQQQVLWTVEGDAIKSANGKYISLVGTNAGSLLRPNWVVQVATDASSAATHNIEAVDGRYYCIGNKVNVSLILQQPRYLTVDAQGALAACQKEGEEVEANAQWLFVNESYFWTPEEARAKAVERLEQAVAKAKEVQTEITDVPGLNKVAFQASITAAETMLNVVRMGLTFPNISTQDINNMAATLERQSADFVVLRDYYMACQGAIENTERMGDAAALRVITNTAKSGLQVAASKESMLTAMTVMRTGVAGYLQTVSNFPENVDMTGLVGNHSFETGDVAKWTSIGFDLELSDLMKLGEMIAKGDFSALASSISLTDNTSTFIENKDAAAIEGADKKYYINTKRYLAQALIGLPAGEYALTGQLACTTDANLNVQIFSLEDLLQMIREQLPPAEDITTIIGDLTSNNFDLSALLKYVNVNELFNFITSAQSASGKARSGSLNKFAEAKVTFEVPQGSVVLISMNTGIIPFVSTAQFRADDLRLTLLHADVTGIESLPTNQTVGASSSAYDLLGRPVPSRKGKGVVVVGGRKVLSR